MRCRGLVNFISVWSFVLLISVKESSGNLGAERAPTDEYLSSVQNDCFASKRLASCIKYRVARYIWSFATGRINIFDFDTASKEFANGIKVVQLSEPDNVEVFPEARQLSNDNEVGKVLKFLKRSMNTFIGGHGVRLGIGAERGPRILDDNTTEDDDSVKDRRLRKKKWNLIFPLAILGKLLHLKFMLFPIITGIGAIQLLLIVGGALIFTYLKNNTLCRIQPHLVHSHSHVASESAGDIPASLYSGYGGYGGAGFSGSGYLGPHGSSYSKDWASNRAYSGYSSFLDAINQK